MKLRKSRYDDIVLLKFTGELETFNLPDFSDRMDRMIAGGDRDYVLDLHLLTFINSAALGYLIRTARTVKEKGGEVVLARPSRFVRKTLVTLGLEQVFPVFETVEDGILHFKRGADVTRLNLEGGEQDEAIKGSVPIVFRRTTAGKGEAPPNQVGRIVTLLENGLLFRYDSGGPEDPVEKQLTAGSALKIKFRQPFAVKEHYFEMEATITEVNVLQGEEGRVVNCRVRYDKISDEDEKHLAQFLLDQEMWRAELRKPAS
jgi:anti-anti-sigma factor